MFTIIIPTHDRPDLLRRTLRSVIAQTYKQFTVVIVSDSSQYIPPYEELLALQGRYTYVIRSDAPGPAESRNLGVALSKSRYVMFLDDDDTLEPAHLESLAGYIGNDSPELLFCDFKIRYEDRTANPPQIHSTEIVSIAGTSQDSVYVRNRIPNSSLVYRRDVIADIKHDSEMIIYEDWDFLLACLGRCSLSHVPISSVIIHKSLPTAPENMRRGNTRDDLVFQATLDLYKKYPAPNMETRLARQSLFASVGMPLNLEYF